MTFDIKKVLVLRFSSIGDIVITTPVVRAIKEQLKTEVHYLTKAGFVSILEDNPYIDKIICFKSSTEEVLPEVKREGYDIIVDLHKNIRSIGLSRKLGIKYLSFDKLNVQKWLLVNFKWNRLPKGWHLVDRYFEGLKELGLKNDGKGLDFFLDAKNDGYGLNFKEKEIEYEVLVLGANYYTKRIPLNVAKKIISRKRERKVVLIGGKDAQDVSLSLENNFGDAIRNMVGSISLQESAAIIKYSSHVHTSDTGMMHIAAAFNKEITVYWGSTVPSFGMYPYMPKDSKSKVINMEVMGLSCRPCSKIGYGTCPKRHFKCMNEQKVDT